jgi:hypothetical protein
MAQLGSWADGPESEFGDQVDDAEYLAPAKAVSR